MGRISVLIFAVFALFLFIAICLFSGAYAAETPDSCPTEFDPDNSAWAIKDIRIDYSKPYIEHRRLLGYFPDPEKRIFVGMKKSPNSKCVADLYSYGSQNAVDGMRVWGFMKSPNGIRYYLLKEGMWEVGDHIVLFPDCKTAKNCKLIFTLFKEKKQIASRVVEIK